MDGVHGEVKTRVVVGEVGLGAGRGRGCTACNSLKVFSQECCNNHVIL